jgi:hypothetical protein
MENTCSDSIARRVNALLAALAPARRPRTQVRHHVLHLALPSDREQVGLSRLCQPSAALADAGRRCSATATTALDSHPTLNQFPTAGVPSANGPVSIRHCAALDIAILSRQMRISRAEMAGGDNRKNN